MCKFLVDRQPFISPAYCLSDFLSVLTITQGPGRELTVKILRNINNNKKNVTFLYNKYLLGKNAISLGLNYKANL